jgi:hypothetical protein
MKILEIPSNINNTKFPEVLNKIIELIVNRINKIELNMHCNKCGTNIQDTRMGDKCQHVYGDKTDVNKITENKNFEQHYQEYLATKRKNKEWWYNKRNK